MANRADQEYQDYRDGIRDWAEDDYTVPDTADPAIQAYRDEMFEKDILATNWAEGDEV